MIDGNETNFDIAQTNQKEINFREAFKIPEKEEVSLKTLKESETEKIMKAFEAGKQAAEEHYKTIEGKLIERTDIYEAKKEYYKKKFPILSETSNWVSKDVKTTIDWLVPSLMEVFMGSDSPIDVQGVNVEDDNIAKKIQALIKYQVERKNNYFTFLYPLIKEGLKTNYGIAKVYWRREEEVKPMEVMVTAEEIDQYLQLQMMGKIEITDIVPLTDKGDLFKIEYDETIIKANYPVIESLPPSELRFTPESNNLQNAKFVAHRKIVKGDYLKRKEQEGIYQNVDKAMKSSGDVKRTTLDYKNNPYNKDLKDGDLASKEVELYEGYLRVDYNNDGIFELLIVHAVGNTPLRIAKNDFEMPPFFVWSPEYTPYTPFGDESFADNLEQLQDLKTALVRQIITIIAKNNSPQRFINMAKIDMDALIDNEENIPIRDTENLDISSLIFYPPSIPMSPAAMNLVEYAQNEIESQSGSTRYNQGLDSNSLNKTATGINAIMGAADKRIKLLARMFAETLLIPVFKFLILLNQKYLDEEQIIRLMNENITIRKEELSIDYDLIVNVGQGAGTKEASIQYLMVLINQIYPVLQQQGIVNADSWFNITKELLEKMGMRNITSYLMDPSSPEAIQKQQIAMQQAQLMQAQQLEQQKEIEKLKNKPRLSINYRDLPPEAKQAFLFSQGANLPLESIEQKELLDKMR